MIRAIRGWLRRRSRRDSYGSKLSEVIESSLADGPDISDLPKVVEAAKEENKWRDDLPGPEDYAERWIAGMNQFAVAIAEIREPVEPCEICKKRHVIPPPVCAVKLLKLEAEREEAKIREEAIRIMKKQGLR